LALAQKHYQFIALHENAKDLIEICEGNETEEFWSL
jgi:hypothetical protein